MIVLLLLSSDDQRKGKCSSEGSALCDVVFHQVYLCSGSRNRWFDNPHQDVAPRSRISRSTSQLPK